MKLSKEEFPVVVFKKGGIYYGVIKELSLLEKGEDISMVYEKIQSRKMELLRQFKEAHLDFYVKKEEQVFKKSRFPVTFSLNFVLAALILMIPLLSILHPLSACLSRSKDILERVSSITSTDFILKLGHRIQSIPPENKKEIKEALHSISTELKPFIAELFLLSAENQDIKH